MKEQKNQLILCIINNGFCDLVMEAAKKAGAKGGTVFHGRGTGNKDMEKFFGITVAPEKDIVMIVADTEISEGIIAAIYKDAGLDTKGQGIVLALPVDEFLGPQHLFPNEFEKKEDSK